MPRTVSEAKRFGLQILNYCDIQECFESEACRIIQNHIFSKNSYLKVGFYFERGGFEIDVNKTPL